MPNLESQLLYPDAPIGADNLLVNNEAETRRMKGVNPGYTSPSENGHYRAQYPWDSLKFIKIYALSGRPEHLFAAEREFATLLSHQLSDGLIPNQIGIKGKRIIDLESIVGIRGDHCNYGQPPLTGMAALYLHQALLKNGQEDRAKNLLSEDTLKQINKEALYWVEKRHNDINDSLVGNIRTEETGRDESPDLDELYDELDFIRIRPMRRNGPNTSRPRNIGNTAIVQFNRLLVARHMRDAASIEEARETFWFNDIEFNVHVAVNCFMVSELNRRAGEQGAADKFAELGRTLESQILKEWQPEDENGRGMWFPHARNGKGMFYGLDRHGKPLDGTITSSNFMPLMLPNLGEEQLEAILDLAPSFIARYGISTVDQKSPNYDPDYGEKASKWHGPDWLDRHDFMTEGLRVQIKKGEGELAHRPDLIQRCREFLWHLSGTGLEVLTMWAEQGKPIPEFHNPETGRGLRLETVQGFGWNNLGYVIPSDTGPSTMTIALLRHSKDTLELLGIR